jgi:cyclopropane fatty-acyl-phospholipid synthase-like methyltransferase
MTLIAKKNNREIWAHFDHSAEVYELFFDKEGESYTGWNVDSIKDAKAAAKYIFEEILEK